MPDKTFANEFVASAMPSMNPTDSIGRVIDDQQGFHEILLATDQRELAQDNHCACGVHPV